MISLSGMAVLIGAIHIVLFAPLVMAPGVARSLLKAFPRNFWAGIILASVALAWAAWEVNDMPLGFIDAYKKWLWVLGPVVFVCVLAFMNELLAPRALGGLLMLVACPVLELQRVHLSAYTLVLAVLAYVWVIAGMMLMLSPYRFRQCCEKLCGTDTATRGVGVAGIGVGLLLVGLGVTVFK